MVIGADVTVGENTVIERSVVGDGCRIGQGVTIVDSYLWAGAEVGDGARIEGAIVASRAMAKTPAGERMTGERCNLVLLVGKRCARLFFADLLVPWCQA